MGGEGGILSISNSLERPDLVLGLEGVLSIGDLDLGLWLLWVPTFDVP